MLDGQRLDAVVELARRITAVPHYPVKQCIGGADRTARGLHDSGLQACPLLRVARADPLVIGAVIALLFHINVRVIGLIMGFGAGVLISAVAFDLVDEAAEKSTGHGALVASLFAGCLVFFGGDRLIDRLGGGDRKDATGD
jgi:hypothetical protein